MNDLLPVHVPPPQPPAGYGSYGYAPDAAPSSPNRIRRYLGFLRRLWWLPVLTFLLGLGAALAFILTAPPIYVSKAAFWETEKFRLPEGAAFTDDMQNHLGTQVALLNSGRMQQMASERLGASGTNAVPLDKDGKPPKVKLKFTQAPKSSILLAEASCANPQYAQSFLTALMTEYLEYKKAVRKLVSGDTLTSISDQITRAERDLKAYQDALTTFQRTNNLAILQEEGMVAGSYLTRLKTEISDLKLQAQLLEATALEQEAGAQGGTNSNAFLLDPVRASDSAGSSPAVAERQSAFKELQLLQIERDKLSKFFKPKHPEMVRLDRELERSHKLLDIYRTQSREQLDASRKSVKMKIASVEASIKEWELKVVEANAAIAEAERLKLNVNRTQSLYDRLALMLQNVDISRNIDQETTAILEPAEPAQRSTQMRLQVLGLGLGGGLFLGLALVLLVEMRDDRLTSIADVNQKLTDNIVGQVPEIPLGRGKKSQALLPLLEANDDRHALAESYRNLRSALLFLPGEGPRPQVLLITSAVPNEGKSTVAVNLARTLAQGGARTLLVDGDLRRGRLHEMLGLLGEPGLADLLQNPGDLANLLQCNSLPNLAFLARGNSHGIPGDLFLSRHLDQLLARWRQDFDYVLIDSGPVFASDDAPTLAPKVDGTLFVVRNQFSRLRLVREALDLLFRRQARVLGVVFNRATLSGGSYNFYKHPGYDSPARPKPRTSGAGNG